MDIAGVDVEIDVLKEYPELEDLVVNSSTEDQNFNSSKYGFKSVTINAIKGEELDLNPSTAEQNVEGVFTKVKLNPIKTQKLSTVPTTQEQVITGLFDEVTVNAIEGEELNLNPSEEQQNYEGVFLGVNIKPIQVEEITTDLDFSSSDAIELTAQEGAYIKKAIINKDANLTPENIKSGVTISGISGDVADTSDADATSEDIVEGKTAYVGNQKIQGTFKGVDTSDATATADDIAYGKTVWVNGEKLTGTLKLPYTQLEYIQADAESYIDSGIKCSTTIGAELTVGHEIFYSSAQADYFGAWADGTGIIFQLGLYYSASVYKMNWREPSTRIYQKTGWHTFIYDPVNAIYTVDNYAVEPIANTGLDYNLYLFGCNQRTNTRSGIRISSCKIYDKGVLVRDFIPVIRQVDNKVCMYDLVTEQYFFNAGTGTFTAGPEI